MHRTIEKRHGQRREFSAITFVTAGRSRLTRRPGIRIAAVGPACSPGPSSCTTMFIHDQLMRAIQSALGLADRPGGALGPGARLTRQTGHRATPTGTGVLVSAGSAVADCMEIARPALVNCENWPLSRQFSLSG